MRNNIEMEEEARKIINSCDEFFLFATFDDDTASTLIKTRDFQDMLSMYVEATAAALIEYDANVNRGDIAKDSGEVYKLAAYFSSALFDALSDRIANEVKRRKSRRHKHKTKVIPLNQIKDDDD